MCDIIGYENVLKILAYPSLGCCVCFLGCFLLQWSPNGESRGAYRCGDQSDGWEYEGLVLEF